MKPSEVDLFHDGLLHDAERDAFLARAAADPAVQEDLAFRESLDARLSAALGAPPDYAGVDFAGGDFRGAAEPQRRSRVPFFAVAAALLLGAALVFSLLQDDPQRIDAAQLWGELQPAFGCQAPVVSSAEFAEHCRSKHGVAMQIDLANGAYVHGPTESVTLPTASVLAVAFPPKTPGQAQDVRVVLIGRELPIRASDAVRVFRREVNGLRVVELTSAEAPRALQMFR